MLSTQYRLRLQAICKDIAAGTEVSLEDMIWANKLAKANTSARGMLSQARRLATDDDGSWAAVPSNGRKFAIVHNGIVEHFSKNFECAMIYIKKGIQKEKKNARPKLN